MHVRCHPGEAPAVGSLRGDRSRLLRAEDWKIQPWIFVPKKSRALLDEKLKLLTNVGEADGNMPPPEIKNLEEVAPWEYAYDRTPKGSSLDDA